MKEAFKDFGTIQHSEIFEDDKGRSKGFGIVLFEKAKDAEEAIRVMDQAKFNDRVVHVKLDRNN